VDPSMSLKSSVTAPVGSSCTQDLLTNDAQRIPDTPGLQLSMRRLHVSPALYHLLRLKEVKPLLL
jgi:hypothetical protein